MTVCATCRNQRWQLARLKWPQDVAAAEWVPFDRGTWSAIGAVVASIGLASKAIRPCPTCNPQRRAPWHKEFKDQTATTPQQGEADETPF